MGHRRPAVDYRSRQATCCRSTSRVTCHAMGRHRQGVCPAGDARPCAPRTRRPNPQQTTLGTQGNPMSRFIAFLYGLASYVAFFVAILYAIGFLSGLVVPKSIDTGTAGPMAEAFI